MSAVASPESPPASKAGLRKPMIIGIAVSVTVVVVAVSVFLVYWFVLRSKGHHNAGSDKFGAITVTDAQHGAQLTNFSPGDTVKLQYQPTSLGFSGKCVWALSLDGGTTYPVTISDPTSGNTINWVIADNIFTQNAVFKVSDAQVAADFVSTAQTTITIDPGFVLVGGPGVSSADTILQGNPATSSITTDTGLTGLSSSGFQVELSKDPKFLQGVTLATDVSATIDTAESRVVVTWTANKAAEGTYYRVATTTLVANGYPYELSVTSPNTIIVEAQASCSSSSSLAADGTFRLCQLKMSEKDDGRSTNFIPGSNVLIFVAFSGPYPGSTTFSYKVDGGSAVNWTVSAVSNKDNLLQFQAQLPDVATANFVVTAVSGTSSVANTNSYNLIPAFVINITGTPTFIINPACNSVNSYLTPLTLIPPSFSPSTWQVGWSNMDGSNLQLYSATFVAASSSLQWCMDNSDFPTPSGTIHKRLVVSTQSSSVLVQQSIPVYFSFQAYTPSWTALTGFTGTPFEGCSVNGALLFGSQATTVLGLWPAGLTPAQGYYISTITGADQSTWFGTVTNNVPLTDCPSLSGASVNYVQCVNQTGPGSTPPATAGLYTLAQGPSGTVQFSSLDPAVSPQILDVQICADDTCPGGEGNCPDSVLLAGTPDAPPSSASNFVWPGQRFPWG